MEKAILVAVKIKGTATDLKYSLNELNNLATGLSYQVVNVLTQALDKPTSNFYIGAGKVEELKIMLNQTEATTIIFDDELSPSQIRNLENALNVTIMDRAFLILRIFEQRASTTEAKLEIKLAMNKYLLPREISKWGEDSREGGTSGSLSNRGSGETKRELNKRMLANEIVQIEKELAKIHQMKDRQIQKRKRNQVPIVALVGYTNAGKSTTMNTLINYLTNDNKKEVYAENKLFATLNTFNRRLTINNCEFVLVDTIGFVSKLPHDLINSFKTTLKEIQSADYILHIVDISSRYFLEQINITNKVLNDIGVKGIPMLYVLNKYDMYDDQNTQIVGIDNLPFSNKSLLNIEVLVDKIYEHIKPNTKYIKLLIPYSEAKILNYLIENTNIYKKEYSDNGTYLELEIAAKDYKLVEMYEIDNITS